jgi:uncharacterized protein (DUF2062 family)
LGDLPAETVALMLALGLVLGTFPVFGFPTILCAVAALMLRLNVPALQVVNQLSSPLQIGLLAPLIRAGSHIVGAPAGSGIANKLGTAALHAVVGWCCICIPLGIGLYLMLLYLLRRFPRTWFNVLESPA